MLTLAASIKKNPTYSKQNPCILLFQDMGISHVVLFRPASNSHYRWCQSACADEQVSHQLWLHRVDPSVSKQETVVFRAGKMTQLGCDRHARGLLRVLMRGRRHTLLTAHLGGRRWVVLTVYELCQFPQLPTLRWFQLRSSGEAYTAKGQSCPRKDIFKYLFPFHLFISNVEHD